jgi:DNA-binding MarR family transcriptional regulator
VKEPPVPDLKLDQQLCFPLYAASNLLTRLYRPLLEELGLTYPQYLVMLALWELAPAGVGELGERLHLDSGTLTPLLKRLEAAGLVERLRDSRDERRVRVSLTAKGRSLKAKAQPVPGALACRIDLPSNELLQLRGGLQRLVQVLARELGES